MQLPEKGKRTAARLGTLLAGALLVSAAMGQAQAPRYVWVTFYYDDIGALVGAESRGDCDLGGWGLRTGHSVEQVYDCDGELPW